MLVLEDHSLPRLALGVITRRGAGSEALEQAGVASLTLDVMKRGAGTRDALALARAVEEMGASLSASAGWDSASVGVAGLSEDSARLFDVLADVVRRPRFDAGRSRAGARRAAGGLRAGEGRAAGARRQAAGARALRRPSLRSVGRRRARERREARRARTCARSMRGSSRPISRSSTSSATSTAAAALEQVRAHFGAWPAGAGLERGTPAPDPTPASRRVVIVDRPDLAQAMLAIGHEGISRRDPERDRGRLDEHRSRRRRVPVAADDARARGRGARLLDRVRLRVALVPGSVPGEHVDARRRGGTRRRDRARRDGRACTTSRRRRPSCGS